MIIFIALIGLSIRSQTQSPAEQYVGDSVSFGQRVISYPIQFVTGSIGDLFEKGSSKKDKNKIKQLEAKNEELESENKKYKKNLISKIYQNMNLFLLQLLRETQING